MYFKISSTEILSNFPLANLHARYRQITVIVVLFLLGPESPFIRGTKIKKDGRHKRDTTLYKIEVLMVADFQVFSL